MGELPKFFVYGVLGTFLVFENDPGGRARLISRIKICNIVSRVPFPPSPVTISGKKRDA